MLDGDIAGGETPAMLVVRIAVKDRRSQLRMAANGGKPPGQPTVSSDRTLHEPDRIGMPLDEVSHLNVKL